MAESPYPMLSVADALESVLGHSAVLPARSMAARDALGAILAEDVRATEALPPFPASVKDGYAVVAADGPGTYPLIGEVTAGRVADFAVTPGTVAYITTGAAMPPGADAVVMVERTQKFWARNGPAQVEIQARVRPGDDVRPVGVDVAPGELVLEAGARLGPAEIGLLATVGATDVRVHPRPRVAVMSTGDELVEPGTRLGPGQIRDSNRAMLLAAIEALGAEAVDLGISGDSQAELEASVRRGLESADILLTSGGVSMGDLDLIKPLLEEAGQVHFGRVRMKPGKPITFATASRGDHPCLVFGLPGNPVSSLVTFYLFAAPAIRKLAGHRDPHLPRVHARLAHSLPLDPERPEYHRATLGWDENERCYVARSTGSQASSRLLSMRSANALLELPEGKGELKAGAVVAALLIA